MHNPNNLPELQTTPDDDNRMVECQECHIHVKASMIVKCSNRNCDKTLCDLCYHGCTECDAPLCYRCATKPHALAGYSGLCLKCQGDAEIEEVDD